MSEILEIRNATQERKDQIVQALFGASSNEGVRASATKTNDELMSAVGESLTTALIGLRSSNAGTFHFATVNPAASTFTVRTSTGYARLVNPDNTLGTQAGTGSSGSDITLTIPAGGTARAYAVISVANGGSSISGDITIVKINNGNITYFSGSGLSSATSIDLAANRLTKFSSSGLTGLTVLNISSNKIQSLSLNSLTSLLTLNVGSNLLTELYIPALTNLDNLYIGNTLISSIDFSKFPGVSNIDLTKLAFSSPPNFSLLTDINALTFNGATGIQNIDLRNSLRANTVVDGGGIATPALQTLFLPPSSVSVFLANHYSITSLRAINTRITFATLNVGLSASALNQFFTDLAPGTASLNVRTCPGALTCNPTIATAKGYSVITA